MRLLGPLEVTAAGGDVDIPGERLRALMVLLALEAGRVVSVDGLLDALYGEDLPQRAGNALQQAVSKLRKRLADAGEGDALVTRPPGYALDVDPEQVDALRLERIVGEARRALASGDATAASRRFADALALWRGEALADLPSTDGTLALKARFEELRLACLEDRVDAELALGHHATEVVELEALVAAAPLRERRWGQLMLAYYRSGRQADALRAFRQAHETLVEELGIEPSPELRRLEAQVLAQDPELDPPASTAPPPPPAPERRRGNLRRPLGPCLGRQDDLARLRELVGEHPLVTIVATGGAGKTRLALELAHELNEHNPDGAWWVDLAPARDRDGVVEALRRTVGLSEQGDAEPVDELCVALRHSAALFVLDNCEQVVDDLAPVVDELLGRCPDLRVLATSREGLGVPGEVLFPLPVLDLDAAVELFSAQVQSVGAGDGDADTVRAICDRLDGLPLAIELAAARARHLTVADILERLDHRFDVLSAGPRTAETRQRSLRAVVDWSFDLLDDVERRVFPRLAVFRGGVPFADAAEVCAPDGLSRDEVEAALSRLADKSLVIVDASGPVTRLRLLQTLVDYGFERLDETGERDDAERRRAAWVSRLAAPVSIIGFGKWREYGALAQEDANVAAAVEWALAHDAAAAVDLAAELGWFWFVSLQVRTGWTNVRAALALTQGVDPAQWARAASFGSLLGAICGEVERARELSEAAIAYEREHGTPLRLAAALMVDGAWRGMRGEADDAFAALADADELARTHDLAVVQPFIEFQHGIVHLVLGNDEQAQEHFERVMAETVEDDILGRASLHVRLGDVAMRRGRLDEARDHFEAARRIDPVKMIHALSVEATARLARVRLEQGALEEADELATDALQRTQEGYLLGVSGLCFQTMGVVNVRRGAVDEGIEQIEWAIARYHAAGAAPSEAMAREDLAEALSTRESLRKAAGQRDP